MLWEAEKEFPLDANFKIYQENIALRFVKPASGVSPKASYWRSPVAFEPSYRRTFSLPCGTAADYAIASRLWKK